MKKMMMKAMLTGLAVAAVLPLVIVNADAKGVSKQVSIEEDGYVVMLKGDDNLMYGDELFENEAPGFPIDEQVTFYNGKVHNPEILIYQYDFDDVKNHGMDNEKFIVPSTCYDVKVPANRKNIGIYTYEITFKGKYAKYGTVKKNLVILPECKVNNVKAKATGNKITVSWTPFKKKYSSQYVSGYSVSYEKWKVLQNQDWMEFNKHKTVTGKTKQSLTVTGLKAKTAYGVMVRPFFKINGKKIYGTWSKVVKVTTK